MSKGGVEANKFYFNTFLTMLTSSLLPLHQFTNVHCRIRERQRRGFVSSTQASSGGIAHQVRLAINLNCLVGEVHDPNRHAKHQ